jgi:hypothetical protein
VDQELERAGLLVEDGDQVASLLGNPPPSRVSGDAGQVHPSACEFDDKQHIHPLQEDRVDGEKVAGQDSGGLLAQERPPARWSAPAPGQDRGRAVPSGSSWLTPGRQGAQLAVDALVAPSWVLAGEPDDELLYLVGDRRAAGGGGW